MYGLHAMIHVGDNEERLTIGYDVEACHLNVLGSVE